MPTKIQQNVTRSAEFEMTSIRHTSTARFDELPAPIMLNIAQHAGEGALHAIAALDRGHHEAVWMARADGPTNALKAPKLQRHIAWLANRVSHIDGQNVGEQFLEHSKTLEEKWEKQPAVADRYHTMLQLRALVSGMEQLSSVEGKLGDVANKLKDPPAAVYGSVAGIVTGCAGGPAGGLSIYFFGSCAGKAALAGIGGAILGTGGAFVLGAGGYALGYLGTQGAGRWQRHELRAQARTLVAKTRLLSGELEASGVAPSQESMQR